MRHLLPAALAAVFVSPAAAQQCDTIDAVSTYLGQEHGESVQFRGLDRRSGSMVEIWMNDETPSWSLVVVRPDGVACLVGYGDVLAVPTPEPAGIDG